MEQRDINNESIWTLFVQYGSDGSRMKSVSSSCRPVQDMVKQVNPGLN
jgi:hypothetical protein